MNAALEIIASCARKQQIADAGKPTVDATDVAEKANVRRNAATPTPANRPAIALVVSARAALPPLPANEKTVKFMHRRCMLFAISRAAAPEASDNAMN